MKKHIFQKTLATLLTVILVLGTLAALPITVGAAALADSAAWDGSASTQPTGAGTESDPYLIASGANLAWVSANATTLATNNAVTYLKLTANINLADKPFTPINMQVGTVDAPVYKGMVIDGQGATISGLNVVALENGGLFANLGVGSVISDLHFVGASVEIDKGNAGVLAGQACGPVTVKNCSTDATSKVTSYISGGFIGRVVAGGLVSMEKCLNRASVTGNAYDGSSTTHAAGMIGRHLTGASVSFDYCVNEGALLVNCLVVSGRMGGMLGHSPYAADNTDKVTITNCYNVGTMTATNSDDASPSKVAPFVGAMVGHMQGSECTIKNCYDYSVRDLSKATVETYHYMMIGDGAGAETAKYLADIYAVIHPDNAVVPSALMRPAFLQTNVQSSVRFDNTTGVKSSLTASIPLAEGTSTILAEMTKIAAAVGATAPTPSGSSTDTLVRDYTWYTAEGGTEAAPYEIGTAAQWAAFVALTNGTQKAEETTVTGVVSFNNKYIKLTADIDLTGYACAPINGDKAPMTIHVDGTGHAIKNHIQAKGVLGGLFGFVSANSTFKNLTLKDASYDGSSAAAGFVANTDGGLTFINCRTESVTVKSGANASGFVAYSDFSADENSRASTYDACINDADITVNAGAAAYAGGFFGVNPGNKAKISFLLRYCVNTGDITVQKGTNGTAIGGFIAKLTYDFAKSDNYLIEAYHCYNTGKLAAEMGGGVTCYVGGFIGHGNVGGEMYLENIYDYSARVWTDAGRHGGLVGDFANSECVKILKECYAANATDSANVYSTIYAATRSNSTLMDKGCSIVESVNSEISFRGEAKTLQAELDRIDALLESVDPVTGEYDDSYKDSAPSTPSTPSTPTDEETEAADDEAASSNKTDDAADADETTEAPAEEGCGSSITATFAVMALTAACGVAVIGKKKED